MWVNFSAEKREKEGTRAIYFRVNIENFKIDNVAYEYPPSIDKALPVKFDKVVLRQVVNDYDYIDVEHDPAAMTTILKKFFSIFLNDKAIWRFTTYEK